MLLANDTHSEEKISSGTCIAFLVVVLSSSLIFNGAIHLLGFKRVFTLLVMLAGGTILTSLIVWKPFLGIWLIGLFIPFEMYQRVLPSHLTIGKLLALITLASWLLNKVHRSSFRIRFSPEIIPLTIFIIISSLSALAAYNKGEALSRTAQTVSFWLLFILIIDTVRSENQVRLMVNTLLITGLFISLIGFGQYVTRSPLSFGLVEPEVTEELIQRESMETGLTIYRVWGTFNDPNEFAGYLVLLLFITLTLFTSTPNKHHRTHYLVFLLFYSAAIVLTWSRGGYLAAIVAFFIFLLLNIRKFSALILAPLLAFAVIITMPPEYIERFMNIFEYGSDTSAARRLMIWQSGMKMALDNILLGVGPGNFTVRIGEYNFIASWAAHNNFILHFAETGILGIISLILFLSLFLLRAFIRIMRGPQHDYKNILLRGIFAGTVGYLFQGMFINNLSKPYIWYFLGIGAALMLMNKTPQTGNGRADPADGELPGSLTL